MPARPKTMTRMLKTKALGMVLKRKGYNEKLSELRKKSEAKEQAVNLRLNAFRGIEQVFEGKITGVNETPKSFATIVAHVEKKVMENLAHPEQKEPLSRHEMQIGMNSRIITGYLELLGYGEILKRKGLEKALNQFLIEKEWQRKQK